jgi:23S rRNA (uracil1939-C5)-methyltransferase
MIRAGDSVQVRIDRLAYGGRGVGRINGLVLFVRGGAAGDVVVARVDRVRRTYAEGEVTDVVTPSGDRVAPPCPHFGPCGGCAWQHLSYSAQARAKEAVVGESLARLGGIQDVEVSPIVPAPSPWYYRNKMEFSFHPDGTLGLHRRGDWNRIVPIQTCLLQSSESAALVGAVREFARGHGLVPYDPRTRQGFLRSLVIREGHATGDRLVGLITTPGPLESSGAFTDAVRGAVPGTTGIVWGISAAASDGVPPSRTEVLWGRGFLDEVLAGLRFRIGLDTFFQTNTAQAERMVAHVVERAQPLDGRLVVDLYCGVGTFTLPLARSGARVTGIELSPSAVEAARTNAALNGIEGAAFASGDVRVVLPRVTAEHGPPDVLVLDPPRAGAGGKVMRKIGRAAAARVIYVSCNPTTLAADLKELLPFGYRLVEVQPFDLFPQTYHVEAIAVLDRTGGVR